MPDPWQTPFDDWRLQVLSTQRLDRGLAEAATTALYELLGRQRPWFVWCDGPFQLALLPSLFIAVVRSPSWRQVVQEFQQQGKAWNPCRQKLEAEIIDTNLSALLNEVGGQEACSLVAPLKNRLSEQLHKRALYECEGGGDELSQRLRRATGERLTAPCNSRYGSLDVRAQNDFLVLTARMSDLRIRLPEIGTAVDELNQQVISMGAQLAAGLSRRLHLMGGIPDQQWQSTLVPGWEFSVLAQSGLLEQYPELSSPRVLREFRIWRNFAQSVFACLHFQHLCFLCERPATLFLDDRNRLHNLDGPAATFHDGLTVFAQHGAVVRQYVVMNPELITVAEIENENNIEVRRTLIERYGMSRYMLDSGARVIAEDKFGTLYMKHQAIRGRNSEPLVMVKVKNSTPEPDGTYREYFLRVPPDTRTAREAVAWTFGLSGKDYAPEQET